MKAWADDFSHEYYGHQQRMDAYKAHRWWSLCIICGADHPQCMTDAEFEKRLEIEDKKRRGEPVTEYAETKTDLARELGYSLSWLCKNTSREGFPPQTANGWDIEAVRAWFKARSERAQERRKNFNKPKGQRSTPASSPTSSASKDLALSILKAKGWILERELVDDPDKAASLLRRTCDELDKVAAALQ